MYIEEASLSKQTTSHWKQFSRNTLRQFLHKLQECCKGFRNTMPKSSMYKEGTSHWLMHCPGSAPALVTQLNGWMHLSRNCTSTWMEAQQGLHRLRKKQPRMKNFSHFIQLSPKDGLIQAEIAQYTFMHSGNIAKT